MSGSELLNEYLTRYFPILFFVVIALTFGLWTLIVSYLVQPKYPEPEKLSTYECGSEPFSDARMPFPVRYYIFAMLFVIFDIEVIFLYPVAIQLREFGTFALVELGVFIFLLDLVFSALGDNRRATGPHSPHATSRSAHYARRRAGTDDFALFVDIDTLERRDLPSFDDDAPGEAMFRADAFQFPSELYS